MKIEKEETSKIVRRILKVRTPIIVAGKIQRPGDFIEVSEGEAAQLRFRGVADNASTDELDASTSITVAPAEPERKTRV